MTLRRSDGTPRPARPRRAGFVVGLSLAAMLAACGNAHSVAEIEAAAHRGAGVAAAPSDAGGVVPTRGVEVPTSAAAATGGPNAASAAAVAVPGGSLATSSAPDMTPVGPLAAGRPPAQTSTQPSAAVKQDTTPVMLCQVGTFSGLGGGLLSAGQTGLSAWVSYVNAHGGLLGHPVRLDSKDDAGDPNRSLQIVQNCVQDEHAVAVLGAFVPITVDQDATYLAAKKVPVIGGDEGTATWTSNPDFFPVGSTLIGQASGYVSLVKQTGHASLAIAYCSDSASCSNSAKLTEDAAHNAGVAIKGTYEASTANPSFTSQCSSMKSAQVEAVLPLFDGGTTQRLARDCSAIDFHPQYVSGGLAFDTAAVAQDPNLNGMVVDTTVFPWMTSATPATQAFQDAMATYAPDVATAESAAKAWTAGVALEKALSNLGAEARAGAITSAMILKGLATIANDSLGGLVVGTLSYHVGRPATQNVCWGEAKLTGGQWIAPTGARVYCPGG